MAENSSPIEIFCAYAHEDEAWLRKLETHLSALRQRGLISLWHDRLLAPGVDWAQHIDTHLDNASVILLLISADFLASDYCYGIEMNRALKRQVAGQARVIPILVRPVDWKALPFAHLQALPTDARAITTWSNSDEALVDVAAGIRRAIEDLPLLSASVSRTAQKEGEFEAYFSERPDVIAEVEKEAADSSEELKMKVASLVVQLEVNMWTPLLDREGDNEHARAQKRLIRCLEKYESDSPEANAFVASCRDSRIGWEFKSKLLDDYIHSTGGQRKVKNALIQLGDSALPLICAEFRKMYLKDIEGEDHYGEEEEDYGYCGAWYEQLVLASIMSKSGDFRTLPFFVEVLLLNSGELSYHNSWATGMARCLRQYRVPIRVIDECMRKVIGISGSYLLYPRK